MGPAARRAFVSLLFQPWSLPGSVTETCGSPPRRRQIRYAQGNSALATIFDDAWKKVSNDGKTWVVDASRTGKQGLSGTWRLEVKRERQRTVTRGPWPGSQRGWSARGSEGLGPGEEVEQRVEEGARHGAASAG